MTQIAFPETPRYAGCSVESCSGVVWARGYCRIHYARWHRHGDPLSGNAYKGLPARERVWAYVDKNGPLPLKAPELGPCWLYTRATDGHGYGHLRGDNGETLKAYRATWESVNGPVPEDKELDHLCRTKLCVRPSHLEPVTHRVNMQRAFTHCRKGHDLEITGVPRQGRRRCGVCAANYAKSHYRLIVNPNAASVMAAAPKQSHHKQVAS